MKELGIFLIVLGYCTLSPAQTIRFSKYYDFTGNGDGVGFGVEVLPQGYAMLTFQGCDPMAYWDYCSTVTVTDTLGEVMHQKIYRGIRVEGMRYHLSDSTFLLWGDYLKSGVQGFTIFMIKTNYQGDTIWSMNAHLPNVAFPRQTLELPDKSILIAISPEFTSGNNATIIKTDSVGQILWVKGYDTGNYFRVYVVEDLMALPDSTVLICANGEQFNTYDGNYFSAGMSLFQIDYDGNLQSDTSYRLESGSNYATPKLAMIPGGRIIASSENAASGPFLGGNNLMAINLDDRSIEWSLGFPESGDQAQIYHLYTTLDSGIVACGSTYTTYIPNAQPCAWLLKSSAEGQLEWQRFLPRTLSTFTNDIKPTPDGGYIVIGSLLDGNYGYVNLIKIDGQGCLQPNCDSLLLTTTMAEPEIGLQALKIQPNPASVLLSINTEGFEAGRLQMVDLLGYIVAEVPVSGKFTTIQVIQHSNGIYAVQYIDGAGKVVAVGRAVVEH